MLKRYVVRIESEGNSGDVRKFNPIALEFPEPLSFQELSRLQSILKERKYERIETVVSRALRQLREEFSVQGQVIEYAVSAKLLV